MSKALTKQLRIPIEGFERSGVSVRIEKLVKIYKSGRYEVQALRGVTATFNPGEITCIMGPSGSGKTTLLNLIGGIDRPTAGKIVVGDIVVSELDEKSLEIHRLTNVGYVFQTFNLIPAITAIENIELPMALAGIPKDIRRKRATWLLKIVGLENYGNRFPDELSGGEQQRIAIAVALANDPPIILADEPTAELDSANAKIVVDLLVKLAKEMKKTVILATHDPRIAIKTDRILRLEDGQIVSEHTPLDLERSIEVPSRGGVPQISLSEIIKLKISQIEKEIEILEERYRRKEIDSQTLLEKMNKLSRLKEALEELLTSLGTR